MFGRVGAGADWERAEAARRRTGETIVGTLKLNLNLTPGDRARLSSHLAESATMAASAYRAGGYVQRTEEVVAILEQIAAAVAETKPVTVAFTLDAEQCRRVRSVLLASKTRAGDLRGTGEAIEHLAGLWERATHYRPADEARESARPPRAALESGGWAPA